jgi:glycosyltransferase involved in cell wall biosynthesis
MKKIAFCISSISSTGGTERVSTEIANALIKEGFEVSFISLFNGFNPKFTLDSNIKLFELYEEKKAFTKHYFNIVSKVKTIVDKEGIDILVGVDTILSMYLVPVSFLCRKKVRVFAWEHFNCNVDFNLKSRKLARFIAAKFADKTIVLTSKDMGLWQAKYKGIKNLICIPNPCVPMVAPINPFNEREKIVLAVGRLTYQKGE